MHILHYSAAAAASAGCGVQQSGGHRSTPAAAAAGEKQQQRRQGQSMRDMTYALVKERLKQTKSDVIIAVVVIIVIIINKNQEPDTVMKERLKRPKSSSAVSLKRDVPRMATAENRQRRKGESTRQDSTQKRMDGGTNGE